MWQDTIAGSSRLGQEAGSILKRLGEKEVEKELTDYKKSL